jgi:hypothetical protein
MRVFFWGAVMKINRNEATDTIVRVGLNYQFH